MPALLENLTGGLNNADPPTQLEPGELTLATNAVYRYTSDLLYHAPYWVKIGFVDSVNNDAVVALQACSFQDGTHKLLAVTEISGDVLKMASVVTGNLTTPSALTWSTVTPSSFGFVDQLVAVPYNNIFYLFTGSVANNVLKPDFSFRAHGLQPVTTPPGLALVTSTWPLGADTVPFFYEYWCTEIVKSGTTVELESTTLLSGVATIYVPAVTNGVAVTRPLTAAGASFNASATHWRIYRSVSKEEYNDQAFPNGELISGDIPIATTGFVDGVGTTIGFTSATVVVSSTNVTNPANLVGAGNATFASGVTATAVLRSFGMAAVTDPIGGIEVRINFGAAYVQQFTGQIKVSISPDAGATYPCTKTISGDGTVTQTVGSGTDLWGYSAWDAPDFSNTLLYVKLEMFGLVGITSVDSVQMRVTYQSGAASSATPFKGINVTVGGTAVSVGEDYPPPVASTGAIFNDSLVVNDIANKNRVWWSVPGKPESFPPVYYVDVPTVTNDIVSAIIVLGNRCLVGMINSMYRLNYLPSEDDIRFQRGPALDLLDPNNGIVAPLACCSYINHEGRHEIAYMSSKGLRSTDGYTTRLLCTSFDWQSYLYYASGPLIGDALKRTYLVNNPDNEELILLIPSAGYLSPDGGFPGTPWQAHMHLHFPYGSRHVKKDGTLKVTGPMTTAGVNAFDDSVFLSCLAVVKTPNLRSGLSSIVFGGLDGVISQSAPVNGFGGRGQVCYGLPTNQVVTGGYTYFDSGTGGFEYQNMSIQSRVILANSLEGEWRIKEVYTGPTVNDTAALTLYSHNQGTTTGPTATATKSLTAASTTYLNKVIFDRRAQGHSLKYVTSNTTKAVSFGGLGFFHILGEDFEKEDR